MANTARDKNKPVNQPFLGLFFDRPPWQVDPRGFTDCNNVRIWQGRVTSFLMGWQAYMATVLNGPVTLIDTFFQSTGSSFLLFGTPTDLYNYNSGTPVYITPAYTTGTIAVTSGGAVTGTGTHFATAIGTNLRNNVRPGDQIYIGSATQNALNPSGANGGWWVVQSVSSDTALQLTSYTGGTVAAGASYTARQLFAGDAQKFHWASETFPNAGAPDNSDLWFATNGSTSDVMFKWNGVTTFGVLQTNMPFQCFEIRRFKNMLVCAGLNMIATGQALPTSVANSDNGLPTSFNTGIAGQYIVTDAIININWLGVLGNTLMIYSGNNLYGDVVSAYFVGAPTNFVFTEVVRGRGPIGSRLVAEFPDRHQFIGQDGEYRYNGLFIQLMNTQVWRQILEQFDYSRADRGYVNINRFWGDLQWVLPLTTDTGLAPSTAFTEHYIEQAQNYLFKPITKRDWPFTVGGFTNNLTNTTFNTLTNGFNTYTQNWNAGSGSIGFPIHLVGDINGNVWTVYSADTQNGAAFTSRATFSQRFTVNERSRGIVTRVYPFMLALQAGYSLNVQLQMYDQTGGMVTISDVKSMPMNYSGNRFTTHYRAGRLGQVTVSTPGPSQPWELWGYDWDVVPGGVR